MYRVMNNTIHLHSKSESLTSVRNVIIGLREYYYYYYYYYYCYYYSLPWNIYDLNLYMRQNINLLYTRI